MSAMLLKELARSPFLYVRRSELIKGGTVRVGSLGCSDKEQTMRKVMSLR